MSESPLLEVRDMSVGFATAQEMALALEAALDGWPGLRLQDGATAPTGVVFRKPRSLPVAWDA